MKNLSQLNYPLGLLHLLPQRQLDVKWMHAKEKCIQNYTLVKYIHLLSFIIFSNKHGKQYLKRINKCNSTRCQIIKVFSQKSGGFYLNFIYEIHDKSISTEKIRMGFDEHFLDKQEELWHPNCCNNF